jgi:hypothetical protein
MHLPNIELQLPGGTTPTLFVYTSSGLILETKQLFAFQGVREAEGRGSSMPLSCGLDLSEGEAQAEVQEEPPALQFGPHRCQE